MVVFLSQESTYADVWASQGPGVSEDHEWPRENVGESDVEGTRCKDVPV